jgi:ABC-type sugar transport system ATPase subunit
MTRLEIRGVSKRFGSVEAVRDLSMTVEAGEVVALLGPSGSGKSTLLRMIAGLDGTTSGTIRLGDRDVTAMPAGKRRVGMVFQEPATFPYLTVADNLAFGMKVRRVAIAERRQRVQATAELLGISDLLGRRPAQLSGGERQRVEIGRALLRDPDVVLMDEPLASLDASLRVELRAELRRIQAEAGTTTLFVTHDQAEAMTIGHRVGVMQAGRLIQVGTPEDLYERPAHLFTARFVGTPRMNLLSVTASGGAVRLGDARFPVRAHDGRSVVLGIRPTDLALFDAADGACPKLYVTVREIEDQGADLVVTGALDDARALTMRLPRSAAPRQADVLRLGVRTWHAFDAGNGDRLD